MSKPAPKPKPTFNWAELDRIKQEYVAARLADVQPPGTFTIMQFAEQHGINRSAAEARVNSLRRQGLVRVAKMGAISRIGKDGRMGGTRCAYFALTKPDNRKNGG